MCNQAVIYEATISVSLKESKIGVCCTTPVPFLLLRRPACEAEFSGVGHISLIGGSKCRNYAFKWKIQH